MMKHAPPDPFRRPNGICPDARGLSLFMEPGDGPCWLYAPGSLESWFFHRLRAEAFMACMHVGHPGAFRAVEPVLYARRAWQGAALPPIGRVKFAACGGLHAVLNGRVLLHVPPGAAPAWHAADLTPAAVPGTNRLEVRVYACQAPPAFIMHGGALGTGHDWVVSTDALEYAAPARRAFAGLTCFPHQERLPEVVLDMEAAADLWDCGVEVIGRPEALVRGNGRLYFFPGESAAEARHAGAEQREQYTPALETAGGWVAAPVEMAMRYLRIDAAPSVAVERVRVRCSIYPVEYRGGFASDDAELDRIWEHAAYTLRLCMRELFVDGIKRDRLPWVGDLYLAGQSNAFAFFDAGIMRRTLTALYGAEPEKTDFNAIVDYSFFWILALHDYVMYFGDLEFLDAQRHGLARLVAALEARRDASGMIPVGACRWLFIDWAPVDKNGYSACLEFLAIYALAAAGRLWRFLGDESAAERWEALVRARRGAVRKMFWSDTDGAFRDCTAGARIGRHANLLAVLAEVPDAGQTRSLLQRVLRNPLVPPVGTPYMRSLECMALARAGAAADMLAGLREYWGGMLRAGAGSFWERYDPAAGAREQTAMYGRPYGASLCHAWSSGPVFLLSRELAGLQPLLPGWRRFALNPGNAVPAGMRVAVPTPRGTICLQRAGAELAVDLPADVTMVHGDVEFQGPARPVIDCSANRI